MKHYADIPPTTLPLALLRPSPFQYRRTASEAALAELAENIKAVGILQPLLGRYLLIDGEPVHELVFGHRRFAADLLAGLDEVPVIVVDGMTDDQARAAQIAENLEREDVHPIEEAEGFQALIIGSGYTREHIAQEYGKSLSYVTGRLKLLEAVPEVRKACLAGDIGSEVALLIARLRTPKLQEKALAAIKAKYYDLEDGGAKSYRQVRDDQLLPDAGACDVCPKRSGNAPEFTDLQQQREGQWRGHKQSPQPNLCTDPDCWEAKTKAHLANKAALLESKGKTVIGGAKARQAISATGEVKGDYIALKDVRDALKSAKGTKPEVITILNPRTGKTVDVVKRDDAKAAGVKVAAAKPKTERIDYAAEQRERDAKWRQAEEQAAQTTTRNMALLQAVRERVATTERTAADLYLVARVALAGVEWNTRGLLAELWDCKGTEALEKKLGSFSAADLTRLMLDCALVEHVRATSQHPTREPQVLLDMAKRLGVERPQTPADTPEGAAPAAKKGRKAKAAAAEPQAELL